MPEPPFEALRTHLLHDLGAPAPGPPPRSSLLLERLDDCPAALYLWLYRETGREYHWVDRLRWTEAETANYLAEPGRAVWLLRDEALPVGWFELAPSADAAVEIVYFGLLPWAVGQTRGLGRWLLESAVREAYATGAARVVVNTCSLDHREALPNYLSRGFRTVREERYQVSADAAPS